MREGHPLATTDMASDIEKLDKAQRVREALASVFDLVEELVPDGRYKSLAITSFEIAAMWAIKAISRG